MTADDREIVLTVHIAMDDRFEEACIADRVLARLAAPLDDGIKVDAVATEDGYVALGEHLTETEACPYCTATLDHPLNAGLGCTNGWHHQGDRHRREQRRAAIRG
jgi:hypothetical protein